MGGLPLMCTGRTSLKEQPGEEVGGKCAIWAIYIVARLLGISIHDAHQDTECRLVMRSVVR